MQVLIYKAEEPEEVIEENAVTDNNSVDPDCYRYAILS